MTGSTMTAPLTSTHMTGGAPASPDRGLRPAASLALLGAVLGMIGLPWDIAQHIEGVRESVLSPQHLMILAGLGAWAVAGLLAIVSRPVGVPLMARRGGVVLAIGAGTSLFGFPLDAAWHGLFGIDVTLWGPTHLLMLLGGIGSSIGTWMLVLAAWPPARSFGGRVVGTIGASFLLATLTSFQLEYAFQVPQFPLVLQPILSAVAASVGLVAARMALGRGGAVFATLGWMALTAVVVNGWLQAFGYEAISSSMLLASAMVVELAWIAPVRSLARRAVTAGVLAGVVGVFAQGAWAQFSGNDHGWNLDGSATLWLGAIAVSVVGALVGVTLGANVGDEQIDRLGSTSAWSWKFVGAIVVVAAVLAAPIAMHDADPIGYDLTSVRERGKTVTLAFAIADADVAGATWANVTSTHGGGRILSPLTRVAPDAYEARGVRVDGSWHASLRIAHGSDLQHVRLRAPKSLYAEQYVELTTGRGVTTSEEPVPTADQPTWLPIAAYLVLAAAALASLMALRAALVLDRFTIPARMHRIARLGGRGIDAGDSRARARA
ncbi:MAG: conserved rane protein of unknown function [Thermoleophilia bacterium]|nr:conserved rane protein of unknown function [Thermoleophilia bacterium]